MANILSWIAAALLGAASAVLLALLVWNGFLYLEYLRQPPLARPFSHGSFAPVGDDDDWTFKPQFAEERRRFLRFFWRLSNALWPHRRCPHSPDCCSGMRRRRPCSPQVRSAKRDASSAKPSAIVTLNAVGRMLVGVPRHMLVPYGRAMAVSPSFGTRFHAGCCGRDTLAPPLRSLCAI